MAPANVLLSLLVLPIFVLAPRGGMRHERGRGCCKGEGTREERGKCAKIISSKPLTPARTPEPTPAG
eukprot:6250011-Pyramimonas_sp.AAC.1